MRAGRMIRWRPVCQSWTLLFEHTIQIDRAFYIVLVHHTSPSRNNTPTHYTHSCTKLSVYCNCCLFYKSFHFQNDRRQCRSRAICVCTYGICEVYFRHAHMYVEETVVPNDGWYGWSGVILFLITSYELCDVTRVSLPWSYITLMVFIQYNSFITRSLRNRILIIFIYTFLYMYVAPHTAVICVLVWPLLYISIF